MAFRRGSTSGSLPLSVWQVERASTAVISGRDGSPETVSMKLVSIPANPVPDNFVTGALTTPDGVTLRFARWLPPAGQSEGSRRQGV